jgi:hypothetical protein
MVWGTRAAPGPPPMACSGYTHVTARQIGSAAHRRPLSGGSNPCGCQHKPLVSFRINRQLSGWILPPLMIRAFVAQRHLRTNAVQYARSIRLSGRRLRALRRQVVKCLLEIDRNRNSLHRMIPRGLLPGGGDHCMRADKLEIS